MSLRNLEALFRPKSIVVIGSADRSDSTAIRVMRQLRATGFQGPVMPVCPDTAALVGAIAYPDIEHLPVPADLAVVCTPIAEVPPLIDTLLYRSPARRVIKNQVLGFCGIKARNVVQFGSVKLAGAEKIRRWIDRGRRMGTSAAAA